MWEATTSHSISECASRSGVELSAPPLLRGPEAQSRNDAARVGVGGGGPAGAARPAPGPRV